MSGSGFVNGQLKKSDAMNTDAGLRVKSFRGVISAYMKRGIDFFRRCAVVALILGWVGGARAADSLHFLVTGDTGSGTKQQELVAEAMARLAAQQQKTNAVDFVMLVGDNFYNDGVMTVDDPQWQEKFEAMYDSNRLAMPFYVVLGNHDWRMSMPDVEIDYPKTHPGTRWHMDGHYYQREFWPRGADTNAPPLAEFFFIDTEAWAAGTPYVDKYPDKKLAEKQMAWLEEGLKHSRAQWKIVAAHHPLYSNGEHGHDSQVLDLRARLGPLFKQYKVDAFITGHDHDLQRIEVPGEPTLFLISGAGGKLRPKFFSDWKPFHASKPGFAAIELTPREMRGEFLDMEDKKLDEWRRAPLTPAAK
jgi:tartrate-resistant acid phosphatase type 5